MKTHQELHAAIDEAAAHIRGLAGTDGNRAMLRFVDALAEMYTNALCDCTAEELLGVQMKRKQLLELHKVLIGIKTNGLV